jgi:adenylyltransferase/sulfurtransferase
LRSPPSDMRALVGINARGLKCKHEFNLTDEYIFHCHSGVRSARTVGFLRQLGFKKVKNLKDGIDAWANQIDPSIPRY